MQLASHGTRASGKRLVSYCESVLQVLSAPRKDFQSSLNKYQYLRVWVLKMYSLSSMHFSSFSVSLFVSLFLCFSRCFFVSIFVSLFLSIFSLPLFHCFIVSFFRSFFLCSALVLWLGMRTHNAAVAFVISALSTLKTLLARRAAGNYLMKIYFPCETLASGLCLTSNRV